MTGSSNIPPSTSAAAQDTSPQDSATRAAAAAALDFVRPGMRLGLGTGSTAAMFVELLAGRVRAGLEVVCVPTSERTHGQAEALHIPLTTLDETPALDLAVDGADEFDGQLRLIKGGGGALLREKIVASASARMVVIADDTKQVDMLGRFPLPVEVAPFGAGATQRAIAGAIAASGCSGPVAQRRSPDGHDFVTDGGHYIFDCSLGAIPDPEALARMLAAIPGVIEHGLFLGLAQTVIVAGAGGARILGEPA